MQVNSISDFNLIKVEVLKLEPILVEKGESKKERWPSQESNSHD
jgi:hypothetical protein